MAKVLAFVLISFFFTDGIPAKLGVGTQYAISCEGKNSTISCKNGYRIFIRLASYGGDGRKGCPGPITPPTRCNYSATGIIKKSCNGRRSCSLYASNSVFGDPCVGTYKYIWVHYRCTRSAYKRVVLCEGARRWILCIIGRVISITDASYGRQERNTCPNRLTGTKSCSASQSFNIIRKKCDQKDACLLHATKKVFGDTCKGIYNYLSVTYRCALPRFKRRLVCEWKMSKISCRNGYTISIVHANYGRNGTKLCPNSHMRTTRCHSPRAIGILRQSCNGRRICSLYSSNTVFGNPCVGTYKYIWVVYRCIKSAYSRVVLCDRERRRISCPRGRVISITRESYGRQERNTCPSSPTRTKSCSASQSINIVKRKCHHKRSCLLHATNKVFRNPCRGTHKYLSVTYSCIRPRYKVGVACHKRRQWISCPGRKKIRVSYVMYGRTYRRTCPHRSLRTTDCSTPHSKAKVAASCNGRQNCLLNVFNHVIGSRCHGRYKYLLVHYYCI